MNIIASDVWLDTCEIRNMNSFRRANCKCNDSQIVAENALEHYDNLAMGLRVWDEMKIIDITSNRLYSQLLA